jgi:hypothetical protein
MYIEMINKSSNRWLRHERDENNEGILFQKREGSKGEMFVDINLPTFLKLSLLCKHFILLLSVPKSNH